ncbi:unnamed protein product, partial [Brassica rapa subsp. trilocularis]
MKATTGEGISYYSKALKGTLKMILIMMIGKAAANEELNAKEEELPKGNPLLDNTPQLCLVSKEGSHLLKSCGMMMWYRESGTWG